VIVQGFLAIQARLKQDFGKVMARFLLYTDLVVRDAGIINLVISIRKVRKYV